MSAPSYGRVLAGVLAGLASALGLTRFLGIPWDRAWEVYGLFPLGAVLGARWAVGKGGTARWVALLGGWGIWALMSLLLFRLNVLNPQARVILFLPDLGILAGAWSAMLTRSFSKLEGRVASSPWTALACVGLLTYRIVGMGMGTLEHALVAGGILPDISGLAAFTYPAVEDAVALVCGLGALAAFAGALSLPWGGGAISAAMVSLITCGAVYVLDTAHLLRSFHLTLALFLLSATAWFAWWGRRMAREAAG